MYPLYTQGDIALVNKLAYLFVLPKKGDIILLKSPIEKRLLIKKITDIKQDKYFVIGENENESTDSRHFGWVERKYIKGKVVQKL